MVDARGSEKRERLQGALDQGMAMLHLDARRPGVLVPLHLRHEFHLRLNLSYRFDPPDLTVSDWGVRSTLSFAGSRFTVAVPWSAVFAITSHTTKEFWLFPDEMPPELLRQSALPTRPPGAREDGGPPADAAAHPHPPPGRPVLREVARDEDDEGPGDEAATPDAPPSPPPVGAGGPHEDPPEPPAPRRGHLRIVK